MLCCMVANTKREAATLTPSHEMLAKLELKTKLDPATKSVINGQKVTITFEIL